MLEHFYSEPELPQSVAVVGAAGFVGSTISGALSEAGVSVKRIGRADIDLLREDAGVRLAELINGAESVVLVSAMAPVKSPAMLRDNVLMLEAMAAAIQKAEPDHVLNIGSDAVFADSDDPIGETSPMGAQNLHGIMHQIREVMLAEAQSPRRFATLRPTLIYGAADPHNGYGPNRFRRQAQAGEPITLFGEGEERRDHVLVDDVAELAKNIILHRSSGSLNAVTGSVISFMDLAKLTADRFPGTQIQTSDRSGPMPHNGYRPFDPSAIQVAFPGFQMTAPEAGLAKVFAEIS